MGAQLDDDLFELLGSLLHARDLPALLQLAIALRLHIHPICFCDASLACRAFFVAACLRNFALALGDLRILARRLGTVVVPLVRS